MKRVIAKAIIKRSDNRMLFLYRNDTHPNFPGHLDLPGGEVEVEENYTYAVVREIQEETSIVVKIDSLIKIFDKAYDNENHIIYSISLDELSPNIKLSWEHSDYNWLSKTELLEKKIPKNVDKYFLNVIDYLKTNEVDY